MKKLILIFLFLSSLSIIKDLKAQWINQFTTYECTGINSISFLDSLNGIATGFSFSQNINGRILYTSNGGVTWQYGTYSDSLGTIIDSKIFSSSLMYSCGSRLVSSGENILNPLKHLALNRNFLQFSNTSTNRGALYISTDKGHSWTIRTGVPNNIDYLSGISFLNPNYGFATCSQLSSPYGTILKTSNGGASWSTTNFSYNPVVLHPIVLLDSLNIYAAGAKHFNEFTPLEQDTAVIYRTTNSGFTWEEQTFPLLTEMTSINFINSSTGIAIGYSATDTTSKGAIYKTTNKGSSWSQVISNLTDSTLFFKVKFLPNGAGLITGTQSGYSPNGNDKVSILKSTDFGNTWKRNYINNNSLFPNGLELVNQRKYYLGGGGVINGPPTKIYFTSDGGNTFVNNISSNIPLDYKLQQNYPNPFNPATNISYSISKSVNVEIRLYDSEGRFLKHLENGFKQLGSYSINFSSEMLASGIYYYSLYVEGMLSDTKKAILIK